MDVVAARHAGPLVTDEGREAAARAAIQMGLGGATRSVPRLACCIEADRAASRLIGPEMKI